MGETPGLAVLDQAALHGMRSWVPTTPWKVFTSGRSQSWVTLA